MARLCIIYIAAILGAIPVCGDKPSWVARHPRSPEYFIGISGISKNTCTTNCHDLAKAKALRSLLSEISVYIESSNSRKIIETNGIEDFFISLDVSRTAGQLEGHELVDTWQSEDEYWVFYRMLKSGFWRKKAEEDAQRLEQWTAGIEKARAFEKNNDPLSSLKMYAELSPIGEFPSGKTHEVPLFFPRAKIDELLNRIKIEIISRTENANSSTLTLTELTAKVSYVNKTGRLTPYPGVSLEIIFNPRGKRYLGKTDPLGKWPLSQETSGMSLGENNIRVCLDSNTIYHVTGPPQSERPLTLPCASLTIYRPRPKVYVNALRTGSDQGIEFQYFLEAIKSQLSQAGALVMEDSTEAEKFVLLETQKNGTSQLHGMCVARLSMILQIYDRQNKTTRAHWAKSNIKGFGLDYKSAYRRALLQGSLVTESEWIPQFVNSF